MFICLIGDEYLINKKLQKKREEVGTENCTFTLEAVHVLNILSAPLLFSDQRTVVYKGNLNNLDDPIFWDFIKSNDPDTFFITLPTELNTRVYNRLKKDGLVHELKKMNVDKVEQYVLSKLSFESDETLMLYMNKASYGQKGGKNLYEIESEIEILSSLHRDITVKDIDDFIEESNYNDIFNIVTLIETKKANLLFHSIDKLLVVNDNVLNILGIIRWRYRLSYKMDILGASESEIGANNVKRYDKCDLKVELINRYSNFIKTGKMSGAQALKLCALELLDQV